MAIDPPYLAAFLIGLTGGVHCFGMCGGIVGALTLGLPATPGYPLSARLPYLLAYNLGRIVSYVIAGALAGGVGAWAAHGVSVHHAQLGLQIVAGLFMILLGLYLAGWWMGLSRVEQAGGVLWRRIEPLGRRFFPVRTPFQALGIGLVWGWLPCGLVYSALVWAVGAGGMAQGGLLMLSFGLGTLPTLFALGTVAATLAGWIRRPLVRHVAGSLVILFGLFQIGLALRMLA
ncbi:MAG TPA: sulfite exporter TauE/SafE family protein [Candidatus Competibacteraceae bacterium]|nr:sulfite exporter TauE/SafE family protein [Candidatus Competibacteraceae bacterium]HQA26567.1 sulfite exporter TauE/SafE family protein [Candidatus Competibacteraceae bacterium]HQD56952.1 sulfite exporter TauE/SafE family protein [Candidatus Competibacteraceae bacterium]